jgi:cytochrome c-type biogenesis protein
MYTEGRVQMQVNRRWGYLSSALMGVVFSAGWIPCVGPVLAAIYVLASDAQTVGQGALLLGVYSAGLGIPFLLTGAAFGGMTTWLRRLNRHLGMISKITGLFLSFVGVLLFMDRLALLSSQFASRFGTGLASVELGDAGSSSLTLPLALVAGVPSFLSPCVLPLIPAYIGYLSGTAIVGDESPSMSVSHTPTDKSVAGARRRVFGRRPGRREAGLLGAPWAWLCLSDLHLHGRTVASNSFE